LVGVFFKGPSKGLLPPLKQKISKKQADLKKKKKKVMMLRGPRSRGALFMTIRHNFPLMSPSGKEQWSEIKKRD
jgi:hypothetical protein